MKRCVPHLTAVALAAVVLAAAPAVAEEAAAPPKPQYIGVEGCALCHKSAKTGDQLGKWQASRHSKAYETLATDKAKQIATAKGIADPQKAAECLQCHVTAHGVDKAQIATPRPGKEGFVATNGVQCEACHGPGSEFKTRKIMKDRAAAVAAGLVIPDKAVCERCHNAKSPTFKGFNFEEYKAKIAHPNPAKGTDTGEE